MIRISYLLPTLSQKFMSHLHVSQTQEVIFPMDVKDMQDMISLTVRARVNLIVVAPRKNVFFHNSPKVVVGHGLKDYGVKNLFTM